ncbi:alpha/beta hydrolase [Streptacidiphilus sp. MAP5-3]|uniref:alpha/beta hydrolase n=1 Tax=unclassified Streptacidiphilus TaxID=2643834 RepID=UPI00351978A7
MFESTATSPVGVDIRREIIPVVCDGITLDLHVWRPTRPRAAVFYFHGLQSHSGWMWETGPAFAERGVAFFVLDRRGSGTSPGARGEIPAVATVLADHRAALRAVRELTGDDVPLGLFGHCLGGSFLAALLKSGTLDTAYDAAVFCSAWLGKLHATLPADRLRALAGDQSTEQQDVGLSAADFTDQDRYRRFIDGDDLAVRTLTGRSRARLLQLEQIYLSPDAPALPDRVTTAFVSGQADPIIDLDDAHRTFIQFTGGRGEISMLPTDRHYLLQTGVRDRLIAWTADFVKAAQPRQYVRARQHG